jgi:hypothetical protein
VALFHDQNGFAEFGGLDRRPPSRRAAADDDEIEIAQLLGPSETSEALRHNMQKANAGRQEGFA